VSSIILSSVASEADLGMFSMFGRAQAPQKAGPHKSTKNYFMLQ